MQDLLLSLFGRLRLPAATAASAPSDAVAALNVEAGLYGRSFDGDSLDRLRTVAPDALAAFRRDALVALAKATGADVPHSVLFNGFPHVRPDFADYQIRRLVGFLQDEFGTPANDFRVLRGCGHVIDASLWPDIGGFGACPICQEQSDDLASPESLERPFERITPLRPIRPADDAFLAAAGSRLLARQDSMSKDERAFLLVLKAEGIALERPAEVRRETLPIVHLFFADDPAYVRSLMRGATDALRIAAFASDPEADLSLAASTRFRLSRGLSRRILSWLETMPALAEDLLRHREPWLRVGEIAHPGRPDNRRRFPRTAAAFDELRRSPAAIETHSRLVERRLRSKDAGAETVALLASRPGEFTRRLDFLLRGTADPAPALRALEAVVRETPVRRLHELAAYLRGRGDGGPRVFVPKGQVTRMQVVDDARPPIDTDTARDAAAIVAEEIHRRLAALPPLGRVYVDPRLAGVVLPANRRGQSSSTGGMQRGSRYPIESEVVRLFVHWKGAGIDVDLSTVAFGEDFEPKGFVGYQRLSGEAGTIHSGDVQSAPNGASEFIDFDAARLRREGIRHLAAVVVSFRGEPFSEFPCFAGFMERDALRSGARYEPESVRLRADVAMPTRSALPIVFDLKDRTATFVDLATGGGAHAGMASSGQQAKFGRLIRGVRAAASRRPSVRDVLLAHVRARGTTASDPDGADRAFALETLDLDEVLAMDPG